MLRLLVDVGRASLLLGAALTVFGFTVVGWFVGSSRDLTQSGFDQVVAVTPERLLFSFIGALAGTVCAGCVFGFAAAVFDIQRNLQDLAELRGLNEAEDDEWSDERSSDHGRREPKLHPRL